MASQQPRPSSNAQQRGLPAVSQKPRQLSHLHSQLAQLTAHISDLENLLTVTAVQAESMRGLGGYAGAMYERWLLLVYLFEHILTDVYRFMAASKVLGEETINNSAQSNAQNEQAGDDKSP